MDTDLFYGILFKSIIMSQREYVYEPNGRRDPEYAKKLAQINEQGIDPFARENISREDFGPKELIIETQYWFAFKNQHSYPDIEHQIVIASIQYAESFAELSPEAHADFFSAAKQLCEMYGISGGGLIMRFGAPALSGASVLHLHGQLLVPKKHKKTAAWFGSEQENA